MAIKELQWVERHYTSMFDECCDFFYCSMRKGTIMHYLEMWDWQQSIYKSKWAVRGCTLLLKIASQIRKISSEEKILEDSKAEYDEYLETEEYKKWFAEFEKNEENNEIRNDPDPKGWKLYLDLLKDPTQKFVPFAHECCQANPEAAELQVKCLEAFIQAKNSEYAIEAAANITKHHAKYHKAKRAIEKFKAYLKEADVAKLNKKASEQLKEVQDELLPNFEKNVTSKKDAGAVLEFAYEEFKLNPSDKSTQ